MLPHDKLPEVWYHQLQSCAFICGFAFQLLFPVANLIPSLRDVCGRWSIKLVKATGGG